MSACKVLLLSAKALKALHIPPPLYSGLPQLFCQKLAVQSQPENDKPEKDFIMDNRSCSNQQQKDHDYCAKTVSHHQLHWSALIATAVTAFPMPGIALAALPTAERFMASITGLTIFRTILQTNNSSQKSLTPVYSYIQSSAIFVSISSFDK